MMSESPPRFTRAPCPAAIIRDWAFAFNGFDNITYIACGFFKQSLSWSNGVSSTAAATGVVGVAINVVSSGLFFDFWLNSRMATCR